MATISLTMPYLCAGFPLLELYCCVIPADKIYFIGKQEKEIVFISGI
jgi:hypothetical protein